MKEHKGVEQFQSEKATVVTIGTFDGVHTGHQKIIKRVVKAGQESGLESVILTFFPHPRMVLQQDSGIKLINTIEERVAILSKTGIDHLVVHPFTKEFSQLDAQEYVRDILVKQLRARKIIIGYDHRFGRNRSADIEDLRQLGKEYGVEVEEISKQEIDEVAVSSTKIRRALMEGEVEKANRFLQYPFSLSGWVIRGLGLGRDLGYPTANLLIPETYRLIPREGVYIVRSELLDQSVVFGLMSIGVRPTIGGSQLAIETHFLDCDADLYGRFISIQMLSRIRDQKDFGNLEALKQAMDRDKEFALKYIQKHYAQ